jgi:hypothetical protein
MTDLLKDPQKTIENLENLQQFKNFAKIAFNHHVNSIYYKNTEEHKQAKRALLITDKDSQISIANKQLLLFFSLQKFEQSVEEKLLYSKDMPNDPEMISAKIKLNPSKKYTDDGKSVGCRYIKVPHVDESKLGNLRDFKFTHGNICRLYTFADKKQIKVYAISETEGNKAINALLELVQDKYKLGTAEEHGYTGIPPKDQKDVSLKGITSKGTAIHVSDKHGKLYSVFI